MNIMKKIQKKQAIKTEKAKSADLNIGKNSFFESILNNRKLSWILLFIFILIITIIRLRLLDIPLERDEGEYAYMGQLLLKGEPPYTLAYNMKYPGTAIMYALIISIFGSSTTGVHLGLLITNISSMVIIYLISKKLMGSIASLVTAMTFGVMTIGYSILGFALHATHFVALFALLGALFLLKSFEKNNLLQYLFAGLFLSLSFIMKQSGVFFIFFGIFAVFAHLYYNKTLIRRETIKILSVFVFGITFPILLMFLLIYLSGAFDKFWFWTYTYLVEYGTKVTLKRGLELFNIEIANQLGGKLILYIIAAAGLFFAFLPKLIKKDTRIFLLLFLLFSFLTIVPGFYFRAHYFITLIPAVSLLIGIFVECASKNSWISSGFGRIAAVSIILIGCSFALIKDKDYLFKFKPYDISRNKYGLNPFPESIQISKYIKSHSNKDDRIAVIGSEPQIYFYADRISSTGYIYTYNLMESHQYSKMMQTEMSKEIEANPPAYIVYVLIPTSWSRTDSSSMYIFDWAQSFLDKNYTKTGVVDYISKDEIAYMWDAEALNYNPKSQIFINVYKRR